MSFKSIMMAFSAILFIFVGVSCVDNGGEYTCNEIFVIARSGDTLWSIAERHCEGDIGYVVDLLVEKYGTDIQSGQGIELP